MVVANKLRVPLGFSLVPLQHAKPSWGLLLLACSAAERGGPGPRYKHGLGTPSSVAMQQKLASLGAHRPAHASWRACGAR